MATSVKWAAELHGVHEVSLFGTADLRFWQDKLAAEGLVPSERDGQASIAIVSAVGKFAGIPFREVSISVLASSTSNRPTFFLCRAFNSSRLFAFCERFLFSTPYESASVTIKESVPTEICIKQRDRTLFFASMRRNKDTIDRSPDEERDQEEIARVILPNRYASEPERQKAFVVRIGGVGYVYSFAASEDTLKLQEQVNNDVFHSLQRSNFAPTEWVVRPNATHAKSKTYRCDALDDLDGVIRCE